MTDDKNISERDAVKRERAAFSEGIHKAHADQRDCMRGEVTRLYKIDDDRRGVGRVPFLQSEVVDTLAAERYPLPKVKRPRVVKDSVDVYWRVIDGGLEWSYNSEMWRPAGDTTGQRMFLTTERIPMLAALLANPDELVDADD